LSFQCQPSALAFHPALKIVLPVLAFCLPFYLPFVQQAAICSKTKANAEWRRLIWRVIPLAKESSS
jgi:hypothetical protein